MAYEERDALDCQNEGSRLAIKYNLVLKHQKIAIAYESLIYSCYVVYIWHIVFVALFLP